MNKGKKPVVFVQGRSSFYGENKYAQNLLLRALSEGITDPQELKKIAGLRRVADVYRSLDKLAIRKEYHESLASNGISLDFIVEGFKDLIEHGSDKIKLAGLNSLIKSIGLDKYEKQEDSAKSWEEGIIKKSEDDAKRLIEGEIIKVPEEYEVEEPDTPEEEKKRQEMEKQLGRELYE